MASAAIVGKVPKYGLLFDDVPLWNIQAEVTMIVRGGRFQKANGDWAGEGLFHHYRALQSLLWPDDDHHEWSDLMLRTILDERITVIQGPKDCSKTHCALSKFALTDFFCFPHNTLSLLSSTDIRGLELRVWGDLKDLFSRAKDVWPDAPGNCADTLHGIFTDSLAGNASVRDIRKGIICIPCIGSNGQWEGLAKYTGIKQKRRRLLGDEVQMMEAPYLSALSNLNKEGLEFKGVFVGNPIGEGDPLDKLAEPEAGWDAMGEIDSTTTWRNKMGGVTIQLYGPSSPNIKEPGSYPYLISQKDIDYIGNFWGRDSAEWWNQAMGVRKPGAYSHRVLTHDMARQFGAMDEVVWRGEPLTKLYGLDAGYGGDRCVGGSAEFGLDINGTLVLALKEPRIIPIKIYPSTVPLAQRLSPEDQIAAEVKKDCEGAGIPPENVFYDATGRGSLGTALARLWSSSPNPLEFGGNPTERPVCNDLFKKDEKTGRDRLIRCDEYYSKRVTQFWFSVRFVVESRQLRQLPQVVLDELCARNWKLTKNDRKEVEPKEDMKVRLGRSPDYGDWCAIVVEGALQRGFFISRLTPKPTAEEEDWGWRNVLRQRARAIRAAYTLDHAVQ